MIAKRTRILAAALGLFLLNVALASAQDPSPTPSLTPEESLDDAAPTEGLERVWVIHRYFCGTGLEPDGDWIIRVVPSGTGTETEAPSYGTAPTTAPSSATPTTAVQESPDPFLPGAAPDRRAVVMVHGDGLTACGEGPPPLLPEAGFEWLPVPDLPPGC